MTDVYRTNHDGFRALALVPEIREDLPGEIREGIARRRLMALGHPCPCGARKPQLNRKQRRAIATRKRRGLPGVIIRVGIEHEDDCPATDQALEEAAARHGLTIRRWDL